MWQMPWQETQKMDQRIEFAMKAVDSPNFRELCREYGISAKTGYKWRARFVQDGLGGLNELSRRPHSHADGLNETVVCEMVRLKNAHRHWGPRKIREIYRRKNGAKDLPSESSFKRVLERAGLTVPRRVRRSEEAGRLATGVKAEKPNDVWTVDFKGWWMSWDDLRVEPLTVRDEFSRKILEMRALENARTDSVRACFERLFQAHGLPAAIRSDNGSPFASINGLLGLTRLSAWWLALGINLERSRPGCPQDNPAHERMHRDIMREIEAGRVGRDQAAFDVWRHEYNDERPHEAIAMRMPSELYQPSPRAYTGTPEDLEYGSMLTRKVRNRGAVQYQGEHYSISSALVGWSVGLSARADAAVEVWFAKLLVGHIHPETVAFTPVVAAPKTQGKDPEGSTAGGAS
jgi:putative transposase